MFNIGNATTNQAFNLSGVRADPKSPLYKELAAKYSHMRDPPSPPADDVNFQDFVRRKIMEGEEGGPAVPGNSSSSSANGNGNSGAGDAVVPHRTTEEQRKKKSHRSKKILRFLCM
ncbi:hypothetical protein PG985_002594 [Apiospora marii]|uniref:uncharacterized protein n=1 Tax=Apiospora marii TaxID=335849 RepID=UPI003130C08B